MSKLDPIRPDLDQCVPNNAFWVFAYGSLMWRPDFPYIEKRQAVLNGFKRSLCVLSWFHRGTPDTPGVVFGLENRPDISCEGCVFLVDRDRRYEVLKNLEVRELKSDVYCPAMLEVNTLKGPVQSLSFIVNPLSDQYAGNIDTSEILTRIRQGRGQSGKNSDYVLETWRYLEQYGVEDPCLQEICEKLTSGN